MSVNKKEMIKEIANLIIKNVDFSEIDYENQPLNVTNFGNYEIFMGYQTDDLITAKVEGVIYEVIENLISFELRKEVFEILEKYNYYDWLERYEWVEFENEFWKELLKNIMNDERVNEQIDWCVFDY